MFADVLFHKVHIRCTYVHALYRFVFLISE